MCAILDANVAHEVFGDTPTPAGIRFLDWLERPRARLVVGGRLRAELCQNKRFLRWMGVAQRFGRVHSALDREVEEHANELRHREACTSDDEHVVALALVSGARLLYTNDAALIADFKNRNIVANPRGKIYTTSQDSRFTATHRRLLASRNICAAPRM